MKKQELFTGIFLIFISIATVCYSFISLKLGTIQRPGPGFMPFWTGTILLILSIVLVIKVAKSNSASVSFWEKGQWVKPLIGLIVTVVYAALMEGLGYILSTMVFLLAWQFAVERANWKRAAVISLIGTAGMYFLFIYLLRVSVPEGILSF